MIGDNAISFLRDADWLTRKRAIAWGAIFLFEQLLLLLAAAFAVNGFGPNDSDPSSTGFVSFYAAGKLVLAGTPALAYDPAAHYWAEQAATQTGVAYMLFIYPPPFLFVCAGLATLPYLAAFALFQAVTLAMFVWVMRGVSGEKGWLWIAPVLAFPPVFWNIGLGQNAFLTAALLGGFTLTVDRRPSTAGILLGLLCYKPHFGLLAPIALAAGRRWRAFFGASITLAALIALSIAVFGRETWEAYFVTFAASRTIYESGRVAFQGMVTVFGGFRLMGIASSPAYLIQAISASIVVGLVAWVWAGRAGLPMRGAVLLVATLLAVPLALIYDELLALVAIGWLVADARALGFLPWEKILLLASYPLLFLTWTVGEVWHVPFGPVISLAVLCLCLRRVRRLHSPGGLPA